MTRTIRVVQLYPEQMNIYGDNGNAQIICRRLDLYGYKAELAAYNSVVDKDKLLKADLLLGGGGQDSGQVAIAPDLQKIKTDLVKLAEDKLPILVICGLYQLFGHYFQTKDGKKLPGISLFDAVTVGGDKRQIGNITINSEDFGEMVGYENHSGITTLGDNQAALGQVIRGGGNDGLGLDEGAIRYSAVGTYLHGPVLSKNPALADWLIRRAIERRYGSTDLSPIDSEASQELAKLDRLIDRARAVAMNRPR